MREIIKKAFSVKYEFLNEKTECWRVYVIWQKFLCASPLLDRAFCSQGWLQIRPISKYGLECLILLPVLLTVGIAGMQHQAWFVWCQELNPGHHLY